MKRGAGVLKMVMVSFIAVVTGLLVAGYTMIFDGAAHVRMSGVGVIGLAGFVVGGLLTAQLNGGRPYGYDLPIGLEQWRGAAEEGAVPSADPGPRQPAHDDGPPMV
jgi:hypothetical protein